jgi:hypothetical protein
MVLNQPKFPKALAEVHKMINVYKAPIERPTWHRSSLIWFRPRERTEVCSGA